MSTTESSRKAIGERLRWAREQAGLSQGQVARHFGMHRPTISQIEAGARNVRADEITGFAELYDVKESWLIRGDDDLPGSDDPRIALAARELKKLSQEDLDSILRLIQVLRTPKESGDEGQR
ncbi:MAG: helix-turn-helix domain-containing protein [bacterium]